jgi:hypothetical protein
MTKVVLRVRLISGDYTDVTYEGADAATDEEIIADVVATLAKDAGALSCRHGERLVVLFARGVAAVEIAPRGAVL